MNYIAWFLLALPFALLGVAVIGVTDVSPWVWVGAALVSFFVLIDYSVCAMSNTRGDIGE